MANTRGGLLVYGVADDKTLKGIDADAVDDRQYAQWLRNHVRPFLTGVTYEVMQAADQSAAVLVVEVAASEFAPHSVTGTAARDKQQNAFVVPFRDGDHTAWMEEHQIARTYRDRFASQERHDRALAKAWNATHELLVDPLGDDAWLVVAAQPVRPLSRLTPEINRQDVERILEQTLADTVGLRNESHSDVMVLRHLGTQRLNARIGLRSWVVSNAVAAADVDQLRPTYLQLGYEGALTFAVNVSTRTLNEEPEPGLLVVNSDVVEVAMSEVVSLARALARHLHHDSPIGVHAGISDPRGITHRYVCAVPNGFGRFEVPRTSRRPRRIQPWTTELVPSDPPDTDRVVAEQLSAAMLNQFGVQSRLYL